MMKPFRTFFSFFSLALLAMVMGCGQKGPLYLPSNTIDLDKPVTQPPVSNNQSTKGGKKETTPENPSQNSTK